MSTELHDIIRDLTAEVRTLLAERDRLKALLDAMTGLDALSARLDAAQGADELNRRAEAAEAEVRTLRQERDELREKLALFTRQLSVQEERTGSWHRAHDELKTELTALVAREQALREEWFKKGWAAGYYDGGEHDCRMFEPTAQRAWEDHLLALSRPQEAQEETKP